MNDHKGYYAILNCDVNASPEEIKKQYRAQVMLYHPDKTQGDVEKENIFKTLQSAYETLGDKQKRMCYDMHIDCENMHDDIFEVPNVFMDLNDLFSDIFPNSDIKTTTHSKSDNVHEICVALSLSEVLNGCTRTELLNLPIECKKCRGSGYLYDSVINCLRCNGKGFINNSMFPIPLICDSCMGSCYTYTNKRICTSCKGECVIYEEQITEFDIPSGTPNNTKFEIETISVSNQQIRIHVKHDFHEEKYECRIKDKHLLLKVKLNIKELLCGFCKSIEYGTSKVKVKSTGYFDISKHNKIKGKGVISNTNDEDGDMYLKFELEKSKYDEQVFKKPQLLASIFT